MSTALPIDVTKTEVSFPITGMTCASCVRRVERAIAKVPGVDNVAVNLAAERATVAYDPNQTNLTKIAEAVRGAGYDVEDLPPEPVPIQTPVAVRPAGLPTDVTVGESEEPAEAVLPIEGMTCASCVRRVE